MTRYIALLRAVNVGGTGKLPMNDLRMICEELEFAGVKTYIASGNVVFKSPESEAQIQKVLEMSLEKYVGKAIGVFVRTAVEMADILTDNPFVEALPSHTMAIFLNTKPPPDAFDDITGRKGEALAFGKREIYVHYVNGMGHSKLKIPAAKSGTARNMNTLAKLVEMAASL